MSSDHTTALKAIRQQALAAINEVSRYERQHGQYGVKAAILALSSLYPIVVLSRLHWKGTKLIIGRHCSNPSAH